MKQFLFLSIFIFLTTFSVAQEKIQFIDKETLIPIPYVTVSFGNQSGIFANEEGEIFLRDVQSEVLFISCLGYQAVTLIKKDIKGSVIYLEPTIQTLDEVELIGVKKRGKSKIEKTKSIKHNKFLEGHMVIIGGEISFLIKNISPEKDKKLISLEIPLITQTINTSAEYLNKKQLVKKLDFASLYKIVFYESENGKPGAQIIVGDDIYTVLNQEKRTVNINLEKYHIMLPENGIFVGLINLGPLDTNGKFIQTEPFENIEINGEKRRRVKPTKPYFPVNYLQNEVLTFYRFNFDENKEWHQFYKHNKEDNNFHNINLGYELKIYE